MAEMESARTNNSIQLIDKGSQVVTRTAACLLAALALILGAVLTGVPLSILYSRELALNENGPAWSNWAFGGTCSKFAMDQHSIVEWSFEFTVPPPHDGIKLKGQAPHTTAKETFSGQLFGNIGAGQNAILHIHNEGADSTSQIPFETTAAATACETGALLGPWDCARLKARALLGWEHQRVSEAGLTDMPCTLFVDANPSPSYHSSSAMDSATLASAEDDSGRRLQSGPSPPPPESPCRTIHDDVGALCAHCGQMSSCGIAPASALKECTAASAQIAKEWGSSFLEQKSNSCCTLGDAVCLPVDAHYQSAYSKDWDLSIPSGKALCQFVANC